MSHDFNGIALSTNFNDQIGTGCTTSATRVAAPRRHDFDHARQRADVCNGWPPPRDERRELIMSQQPGHAAIGSPGR